MIARVLVLITLVCGYAAARYFDVDMYLSLMGAQMLLDTLAEVVHAYPFMSILSYVLVYVVTTAFSIPGGAVLTMLGGALFGAFLGTFLAVIGATIGGYSHFFQLGLWSGIFFKHDTLPSWHVLMRKSSQAASTTCSRFGFFPCFRFS